MSENFYKILGVDDNTSQDEIKKAYRKLSLKYHPDKNPSPEATELYKKINEAYDTLGDEQKRKQYDMERQNPFMKMGQMNGMGGMGGMGAMGGDIDEIFKSFFGVNGMPFGMRMGPDEFGGMSGFPPGVQFQVFHNGRPVNVNTMNKPSPIVKNVIIDIEQVFSGCTIPIEIERWIHDNNTRILENETLYISIPKGIDDGEIIVIKDKGNIVNDACRGDVKLFIKVVNNTEIKRMGLDLIYEKKITLKEALCGFTFEIKYIKGKMYTLNNANGNIIIPGYRKIIPNMGLTRESSTGSLIVIFHIEFPEKLTETQINELKNIL